MQTYTTPTKAEILLTYGCNMACSYCKMFEYHSDGLGEWEKYKELSDLQWREVPKYLKQLDVPFAPIYGAEPLTRPKALYNFIRGCGTDIMTTVITNGKLLTDDMIKYLKTAGLNSITLSHDISPPNSSLVDKTKFAEDLHDKLIKKFNDVELSVTLTPDNIRLLPNFIRRMSEKKIWVSFDICHPDRGQLGSKCRGDATGYTFGPKDKGPFLEVMTTLIDLKNNGYKIHQSEETLNTYIHEYERYVISYGWKCRAGAWITVGANGTVYGCDDYRPRDMDQFNILEYGTKWTWTDFVDEWSKQLRYCPGCIWSTHYSSDKWWSQDKSDWMGQMTHGRKM